MTRVTRRELAALVIGVVVGAGAAVLAPLLERERGPTVGVTRATKLAERTPFDQLEDAEREQVIAAVTPLYEAARRDSPGANTRIAGGARFDVVQLETVLCSAEYLEHFVRENLPALRAKVVHWHEGIDHVECQDADTIWAAQVPRP